MINSLVTALYRLADALDRNTSAHQRGVAVETELMADMTLLTDVVGQVADDLGPFKVSLDALAAAFEAAQQGGFTPADQAALADAINKLQNVHGQIQADAAEAQAALTPPAPPAPTPPPGS